MRGREFSFLTCLPCHYLFTLGTYNDLAVALDDLLFDIIDIVISWLCSFIFSQAMSAKPEVPDAWDADWESQADVSSNTLRCPVSEELLLRTPCSRFFVLLNYDLGTLILTCWTYRN